MILDNDLLFCYSCSGKVGHFSTLTTREALIYKKLTKSDLNRSANGLQLPGKEVREKLLPHIFALTALVEAEDLILVDHQGQEWNMLLVRQNEDLYFIIGHWYDYADKYNLAVSDTIVIEKQQVKEDLYFAALAITTGTQSFLPIQHDRLNKLIILMQRTSKSKLKLKILTKFK